MTIKQSLNESYALKGLVEIFQWDDRSEFSDLELASLRRVEEEIKDLCLDFDPYQPEVNKKNYLHLIKRYQLESFLDNPFLFTNRLLKLMDKVEQALKSKLKQ